MKRFFCKIYRFFKYLLKLTLLGFVLFLFSFGGYKLYEWYRNTNEMNLEKIIINNEKMLTKGDVIEICKIKRDVKLTDISVDSLVTRLERSPYIETAKIRKMYPSTIIVHVYEKDPLAMVLLKGHLQYVDKDGKIIGKINPLNKNNLPVVNTKDKFDECTKFLSEAKKLSPLVYHNISEVFYSGKGVYITLVDKSPELIVGKDKFDEKVVVLESFLINEGKDLNYGNIEYIDLRFENQVVVKEFEEKTGTSI